MTTNDDRCLAEAFAAHRDEVRGFIRRRLGASEDVDDLTQETFLRAQRAGGFEALHNPRAYLLRIADNLVRDRHRRDRHNLFDPNLEAQPHDPADPAPSPERIARGREELHRLALAVAGLPPKARETLILHKFHHLSYNQIAVVMGISPRTVEKHLAKAVAHCRRAVREPSRATTDGDNVVPFAASAGSSSEDLP
jgi:RNA polymerase sigma-70 factor (ECF subfamily)